MIRERHFDRKSAWIPIQSGVWGTADNCAREGSGLAFRFGGFRVEEERKAR